jgi:hypothetical protein
VTEKQLALTGMKMTPEFLAMLAGDRVIPVRLAAASTLAFGNSVMRFLYRFSTFSHGRIQSVGFTDHKTLRPLIKGAHGSMSITEAGGDFTMPATLPLDHLESANYAGGTKANVRFSDGLGGIMDLTDIGLDTKPLNLGSIKQSWGSAIEIETKSGEQFYIDSSIIRAYLDPDFAKQLAQTIARLTEQESTK